VQKISNLFCMLKRYLQFGCTSEKQSSCTRNPLRFHSALCTVVFGAPSRGFIRATYFVKQSLSHLLSFTVIAEEKVMGSQKKLCPAAVLGIRSCPGSPDHNR